MKQEYNRPGLTSRLRQAALAALVAVGTVGTTQAQLGFSAASAINTTSVYTDLGTTGTAIATANTDDANSAATAIGFPFTFNGTAFTDFVLNTNGFLKLGTVSPTGPQFTDGGQSVVNGPVDGPETNLLLPFNQDLTAGSAGGTEYRVATTGAAPNRVCTIQWKNVSDKARAPIGTQYANFSFQVKLYEAGNQIDFVYGTATAGALAADVAKFVTVGLKGSAATTAQVIVANKSSVTPWSGAIFLAGPYAAATNAHNVRGTVLPNAGRTYSFTIQVPNDAAASAIQGFGSMVVPAGNPFSIRGVVRNAGNTALSAVPVTLTISGANTFSQTQSAGSLGLNASGVATFAGISLPNVGTNTVTITTAVPGDGNASNDSFSQTMETSATTFSYIAPGISPTNAYGFTPSSGFTSAFCAKFTVSAARSVTAVRAVIGNGQELIPTVANNQRVTTVFGVVVDATSGALLARSPDYALTAADLGQLHTFALSVPATVPTGDFLVGLAQVVPAGTAADAVFPMAFQAEVPARPGLFFSTGISAPGPPNDATANNARYMLEAVTAAPANSDLAVNEIQGYGSIAVPVGNPFGLRAVVRNAGVGAITAPTLVTLTISGANTFSQTQTLTSLGVGATAAVSFPNISLPNVGANTVTVTLPNDDNLGNNTLAQPMATSATRFSFITPGVPQASSFGFQPGPTVRTQAFCGKFTVNAPRSVTAVRAVIGNDTDLVPNATNGMQSTTVYGVVLNAATGALLARSADVVLVAADLGQLRTFNLNASVPAGDFLVGLAQVLPVGTAANQVFPMAFQNETPARTGLFYTASITTPAAPIDAAVNNARYMLEAETAAPATCAVPTALAVTGTTGTSASFSFTGVTNAIGYQIVYGTQGFTPGGAGSTTSATFTGTTYTLPGLTASTAYDFYIRAICSATDQSALAGPVRATTPCVAPVISTFPYAQNFDVVAAGQPLPCGIAVSDNNNDGFTWRATGTVPNLATGSVARSGPNAMVYVYNSTDNTVGANDWFYTPALALSNTLSYRVAFYYRVAAGGYAEGLEVKYGPAATPAGQTTTLYNNSAVVNTAYAQASNLGVPAVLAITPATGTFYVGFHATSAADQGFLAVDDVTIAAITRLATSEALTRAVSVFPNPSTSGLFSLEIHGANARQALVVEVSNLLGQRVYQGAAKDNFRTELNLSGLAPGIYTLKVRNGDEYTMQRIAIAK